MHSNIQDLSIPQPLEGVIHPLQEDRTSWTLISLPQDLILRLFSAFTPSMLATISLVSKSCYALANKDYIWDTMAANLYLQHDLEEAKKAEKCIKEICKVILITSIIGNKQLISPNKLSLAPRDPRFVARIQQLQLRQYSLLTPSAAQVLMQQRDTIAFMESKGFDCLDPVAQQKNSKTVHHIAQQQVGKTRFDIINYTDYVVSFNEKHILQINDKITNETFSADNCQLIVYIFRNLFHIIHKDMGKNQIIDIKCKMDALRNTEKKEMIDDFYG
jgi:ethanolamine utilization cobalamin adenosyltransferase